MKFNVIRKEYHNYKYVGSVLVGTYDSYDEADCAICESVSDFRDHTDNDERVDWNIVEVFKGKGNIHQFEWVVDNGD